MLAINDVNWVQSLRTVVWLIEGIRYHQFMSAVPRLYEAYLVRRIERHAEPLDLLAILQYNI